MRANEASCQLLMWTVWRTCSVHDWRFGILLACAAVRTKDQAVIGLDGEAGGHKAPELCRKLARAFLQVCGCSRSNGLQALHPDFQP